MIAAVWLMLSGLMYSLQLQTGTFPKPLTAKEQHYLQLYAAFNLCCRLCSAYEHKAFLDGLQYGAWLMKELK